MATLPDAIASLRELSPQLNEATDEAAAVVSDVEKFLNEECSIGLPVRVEIASEDMKLDENDEDARKYEGYDVFNWEDQALRRAAQYLQDLDSRLPADGWTADGDDTFVPWILNHVYGTSFTTQDVEFGELMSYTDWMFPNSGGN